MWKPTVDDGRRGGVEHLGVGPQVEHLVRRRHLADAAALAQVIRDYARAVVCPVEKRQCKAVNKRFLIHLPSGGAVLVLGNQDTLPSVGIC